MRGSYTQDQLDNNNPAVVKYPNPVRLRGDVTLAATYEEGDLKISGGIANLQKHEGGSWVTNTLLETVALDETNIFPDGSYSGDVTVDGTVTVGDANIVGSPDDTFSWVGSYAGRFYGPAGDPETAGRWTAELTDSDDNTANDFRSGRVVGAFGAVKQPEN